MTTIIYNAKNNTLSGDRQCIVDISSWLSYNADGQKVFMSRDRKIAFGSTGSSYGPAEVETFFKDIRTVLDLYYKTGDAESLNVTKVWGSLMNRAVMIFTKDHLFVRRMGEDLTVLDMSQNHTVGSGRLVALALMRANEKLELGLSIDGIYDSISKAERLTGSVVDTIDLNTLVPYLDCANTNIAGNDNPYRPSEIQHHPV